MIWVWVNVFGCQSSNVESSTNNTSIIVDGTTDDIQTTIEPIFTPEEAFDSVESLLLFGIPNPYDILNTYMALYDEGATANCPGTNYNFDSPEADNSGCTTGDGYFFAGLGEVRLREDEQDLHCDCRIVTPDGRMIRGAGNIVISNTNDETFLDVQGSFLRISEDSHSWLNQLPSTNFSMIIEEDMVQLSGGYTINGQAIYFDGFQVTSCQERSGTIFIRDPSGGWWSWSVEDSCITGRLSFQDELINDAYEWDSTILDPLFDNLEGSQ